MTSEIASRHQGAKILVSVSNANIEEAAQNQIWYFVKNIIAIILKDSMKGINHHLIPVKEIFIDSITYFVSINLRITEMIDGFLA